MEIAEIKKAIDDGKKVELYRGAYEVIKDKIGQYLIHCKANDNYIGLNGLEGTEYENVTNYPKEDFYIVEAETFAVKYTKQIDSCMIDAYCPKCNTKFRIYPEEVENEPVFISLCGICNDGTRLLIGNNPT